MGPTPEDLSVTVAHTPNATARTTLNLRLNVKLSDSEEHDPGASIALLSLCAQLPPCQGDFARPKAKG